MERKGLGWSLQHLSVERHQKQKPGRMASVSRGEARGCGALEAKGRGLPAGATGCAKGQVRGRLGRHHAQATMPGAGGCVDGVGLGGG